MRNILMAPNIDETYLFQPVPYGQKIQCRIVRRKKGPGSLYPQYELYLEGGAGARYTGAKAI